MVELSVVIPTIEPDDDSVEALGALRQCTFDDYEVLVRRDDSASLARNEGVKRANGEKIVFIDDDSIPRDGFLAAASEALDEHDAVTGRVVQPDDAPFGDEDLPWYDQGPEPKTTDVVAGCNMAMRRSLFESIGGFNENLPHGHEETELAERIVEETDIYYEPAMVVEHYFAESNVDLLRKTFRHGRATAQWWQLERTPMSKRLRESVPLVIPAPGESAFSILKRLTKRLGRLYGMLKVHSMPGRIDGRSRAER